MWRLSSHTKRSLGVTVSFNPHKEWHHEIQELALKVRSSSHVRIKGSGTTFVVKPDTDVKEQVVVAPSGILSYAPEELVIVAMAGTSMTELGEVLFRNRQRLKTPYVGSLGGAVATRRNGPFAIDNSALPNTVLALGVIAGDGTLFRTGGPTVKNVSGFDLTKIMVGSWGLLGVVAQVTLRTEPIPRATLWLVGPGEHDTNSHGTENLFRPALVCRKDEKTIVLLEGHPDDIASEASKLKGFRECDALSAEELVAISLPPHLQANVNPFVNEVVLRLRQEFDPAQCLNRTLAQEWNLTT